MIKVTEVFMLLFPIKQFLKLLKLEESLTVNMKWEMG